MDRADRWLHEQLAAVRERDAWDGESARVETALAGVDALEAAGAITPAAAQEWRARLRTPPRRARAAGGTSAPAARVLSALVDAIPPGADGMDEAVLRFEGAVDLLTAIGAAEAREWDRRLRERAGWPPEEEELAAERELNAGGTEAELLEVVAGPPDERGGYRLLLVLRYADGVSFLLDVDPACEPDLAPVDWRLTDDAGTRYREAGSGGGSGDRRVSFRTPVPPQARRLRLAREDGGAVFEVDLG